MYHVSVRHQDFYIRTADNYLITPHDIVDYQFSYFLVIIVEIQLLQVIALRPIIPNQCFSFFMRQARPAGRDGQRYWDRGCLRRRDLVAFWLMLFGDDGHQGRVKGSALETSIYLSICDI